MSIQQPITKISVCDRFDRVIDPIIRFFAKVFNCLSCEFILKYIPNGGAAVAMRSMLVSIIIYSISLSIKSYARADAILCFSYPQLLIELRDTAIWFGPIFAAVYAALYTRFSSQWSYLTGFYNQIMIQAIDLEKYNSSKNALNKFNSQNFLHLKMAYIEDAITMHLATKEGIRPIITELLDDKKIDEAFKNQGAHEYQKIVNLRARLEKNNHYPKVNK